MGQNITPKEKAKYFIDKYGYDAIYHVNDILINSPMASNEELQWWTDVAHEVQTMVNIDESLKYKQEAKKLIGIFGKELAVEAVYQILYALDSAVFAERTKAYYELVKEEIKQYENRS